jgi:hypothetical protein
MDLSGQLIDCFHGASRESIIDSGSAPNALTTIEIRQNSRLNAASQLNNVRTLSLKISIYEDDTLQNMFGTYAFEG